MDIADFVRRFEACVASLGGLPQGEPVVVAVSGGLDSCVLFHLLRFATAPRPDLVAAHFDHRMRAGSEEDAEWVRGLCRAWGVPVRIGHADDVPASEGVARLARYGFFDSVRREIGAVRLLTAHHADDQAETVLFRVLRGTGIEGLRGIPSRREPGVVRPLLDFWRRELESYARAVHLSWREDPSNENVGYARNAIRRRFLPDAEAQVAPEARRALVRLSAIAAENEAAWAAVLPDLLSGLDVVRTGSVVSWSREAVASLHPTLRGRVVRWLAAEAGRVLDEAGTRRAVDFATSSRSGSRIDLGGGIQLRRELDRLVLGRSVAASPDEPLQIPDAGPGSGDAILGGRPVPVAWRCGEGWSQGEEGVFPVDQLDFPLTVRGREPGDRIRLAGGSRKVKKLLLEARIPSARRDQVAVLVDATGRVLWVPGVARTSDVGLAGEGRVLGIRIG
jgi:tRNA(Ile)-lysidine synthase